MFRTHFNKIPILTQILPLVEPFFFPCQKQSFALYFSPKTKDFVKVVKAKIQNFQGMRAGHARTSKLPKTKRHHRPFLVNTHQEPQITTSNWYFRQSQLPSGTKKESN